MLTVTGVLIILALCGVFGCRRAIAPQMSEREFRQALRQANERQAREDAQILSGDWSSFEDRLRAFDPAANVEWEKQRYAEMLRKRKTLWRRFLYGKYA